MPPVPPVPTPLDPIESCHVWQQTVLAFMWAFLSHKRISRIFLLSSLCLAFLQFRPRTHYFSHLNSFVLRLYNNLLNN